MKSIRIQGFSGPYFLAFRLNTEVYWLFYKSTFSVQMWENKDQKNFEYGHFLRSADHYFFPKKWISEQIIIMHYERWRCVNCPSYSGIPL